MSLSWFLTRIFLALQARLRDDERGASAVEYALLVVAVAGIVTAVTGGLTQRIPTWLNNISPTGSGTSGG